MEKGIATGSEVTLCPATKIILCASSVSPWSASKIESTYSKFLPLEEAVVAVVVVKVVVLVVEAVAIARDAASVTH